MSEPVELTRAGLRSHPLPPVTDDDKNDHGRLLVLAGSRQVPGSALLCAKAALRSGVGKVRIATVDSAASALALALPEVLVISLAEASEGGFAPEAVHKAKELAECADAVVAGPGVTNSPVATAMARALVDCGTPLVLDAGLLRCLAPVAQACRSARVPPVLLPHSQEMAALLGIDADEVEADRIECARKAAERYGAVVVAKGATSFISDRNGAAWAYRGGVPGLGISGSGDTLAGIVGAQLARGADPVTALLWGVLLHGEAGQQLSRKVGPIGFLASEIPDELPALLPL